MVAAVALAGLAWLLNGAPALAATIQVTTSVDEGGSNVTACSLREAVAAVNVGADGGGCVATGEGYGTNDQITFAASTDGSPILLTKGEIIIGHDLEPHNLQIVGRGATSTILDGQHATRVLQVVIGRTVGISGLTIRNGNNLDGGGIYNRGTLTVTNSTLSGNTTGVGFSGVAGGIYNGGTLTVTNSTLSGNTAGSDAGGIYNTGTLTVTNSTLSGNTAGNVVGGTVGGIHNTGTLTVTNSTLSGNTAGNVVGGIYNTGTLTVTNSTLSGNTAGRDVGGIYNRGTLTVTNSTLSENSAPSGGGIYNSLSGMVHLRASVLDTGARGTNCSGVVTSLGSNIADDTSCGLNASGDRQVDEGAILLGPLANNGGPTRTHRLLDDSPAIDFVQGLCSTDGTANGQLLTTDQRGQPRAAGLRCDAGAVERQGGVLQLSAATYTVAESAGPATIQVVRTGGTEGNVGATLTSTDGSGTAGSDYTGGPRTVTVADGQASATVAIPLDNDTVSEPDETIYLTLSAATGGASLGARTAATLTITNDDPVVLSVASSPVLEGNSGTSNATFTVTRTGHASGSITVQYATVDGSAKAGSDYTATNGALTFAPNESSKTITVPILGDTRFEPDETFTVTLSNPTNAVLGTAQAVGIIQNDDVTAACGPRPRVTQTLAAGGGALAVHIEVSPLNTSSNNPIHSIRFGTFQNATVTLNGQHVTSGQMVDLPPNTVGADFTVRRVTPGQATTVPFTVSDSCGTWDTFVGGGANAGF